MTTPDPTDWKKEFREKFTQTPSCVRGLKEGQSPPAIVLAEAIKVESFISSLLAQQRHEVLEEAAKVADDIEETSLDICQHADIGQAIRAVGEK